MSYVITRNTRADQPPPGAPAREDGSLYDYSMRMPGGWWYCWADDVLVLAGALCGDIDAYLAASEQERLVSRIKASIGFQTKRQAEINVQAQIDGRWEKCTEAEQAMLNGRRDRQPSGWNADMFDGTDWHLAPVDLVVISTGYQPYSQTPMPMTSGDRLWVIDPVVEESWLDSLSDLGVISLYNRTQ